MKKLQSVGISYTEKGETKYINVGYLDVLSDDRNKYFMKIMETCTKSMKDDVEAAKRLNEIAKLEARLAELKSQEK